MEFTSSMKDFFIKNTEEIFNYYYPNIEEINVDHMFNFSFDSNYNKCLINKIKIKIDEILNYLREKESNNENEFKYYYFCKNINFKSKLKKNYVKVIFGILEILKNKDFMKLKTFLNKKFKDFKTLFSNFKLKKIQNLGYFLKLEKINSTLEITEKRCFTERLNKNVIEIITYKAGINNFGSDFNIGYRQERYIKDKSGFLITFDELYEVPKNLKTIFWLVSQDNNMPILNIYFHSMSSMKKYIKKNHKNILKDFGKNYDYKKAESSILGDYRRFFYDHYHPDF